MNPANPMSVNSRPALMPLDEALLALLATVEPTQTQENVSTFEADGCVLAQDLVSALDVPGHDNSSMDGYAVRAADVAAALPTGAALPVSQRIPAGHAGTDLLPGTVARIFTGAPVPPGADAVVMQEEGTPDPATGQVRFARAPEPGQWIRRRGEDIAQGAVVLPRGTRLRPAELGLAASIGYGTLAVVPRPRVALFSTGDELVMPGTVAPEALPPGAIYNSNRFFLRSLLERLGAQVTDLGIVPDRREATIEALRSAAAHNDLILTSGGVSVGEEDHIKPAVQALGELDLWALGIKPGKPFAHGRIARAGTAAVAGGGQDICHFIGLPGNPVSSFVTFLLLVRPFLLHWQGALLGGALSGAVGGAVGGAAAALPPSLALPAHFAWPRADKRREFLRVRRNAAGGLDLFPNQSSGVLTSVAWADGLVDNPPGQTIHPGDVVSYLPLSGFFS